MHPAVLRTCAAFAFLSFAGTLYPLQNPSQNVDPGAERVWLAVEEHSRGQLIIEPIATVDENALAPIQTSCVSYEQAPEDFSVKYLQAGKKYALLFGGAPVGESLVGEQNHGAATANLAYTGTTKIRGQVRALATNAESSGFRVASREPATTEQRGAALTLARELFSLHGIPESLLPKVRAEYIIRTYLTPSAQPSLIGSFTLDTEDNEGIVHHMFLIANQPGEKLQPEFLWIHLAESETDEQLLRLVDQADLLGNGQDEVVAKLISVETQSHRYVVFRRAKSSEHWEQIFKTEPLGCSS